MNQHLEAGESESKSAFLDRIFREGQEDSRSAPNCLLQLQERERDFVESELESPYWNAVSLQSFHVAQLKAMDGSLHVASTYAEIALEAAQKAGDEFYSSSGSDWMAYLKATLAYLQGDEEALNAALALCTENRTVVVRLFDGLHTRGAADYRKDY